MATLESLGTLPRYLRLLPYTGMDQGCGVSGWANNGSCAKIRPRVRSIVSTIAPSKVVQAPCMHFAVGTGMGF